MQLDIRLPLGLIFLIIGALMTGYGIFTRGNAMYASSGGMNINILWGAAMLVFGAIMYAMSRKKV